MNEFPNNENMNVDFQNNIIRNQENEEKENVIVSTPKKSKLPIIIGIIGILVVAAILYIVLNSKKYVVTFDSDGGSKVSSIEVKENEKATKPTDPTKEDYEFVSWELDGKTYDFSSPITKDIELKATWKIKIMDETFKVVFKVDGEEIETKEIHGNDIIKEYPTPEKEHFVFEYWEKDGIEFDFNTRIKTDIELNAKLKEANKYQVIYEVDGKETKRLEVYEGEKVTKINNPTKEGYKFKYWTLDAKEYDFNGVVTSDIKLVAEFEHINQYEVKYNTDGGTTIKSSLVYEGEKLKKPTNPTKEDYEFVSWELDGKEYDFSSPITKDIELKATWKETRQCVVSLWDSFDGVVIDKITISCGAKITKEEVIKKSSKVCIEKYNNINPCKTAKWNYYDKESENLKGNFDFNTVINSDINIGSAFGWGSN